MLLQLRDNNEDGNERPRDYSRILVFCIVLYLVFVRPTPDEQDLREASENSKNNVQQAVLAMQLDLPIGVDNRPLRNVSLSASSQFVLVEYFLTNELKQQRRATLLAKQRGLPAPGLLNDNAAVLRGVDDDALRSSARRYYAAVNISSEHFTFDNVSFVSMQQQVWRRLKSLINANTRRLTPTNRLTLFALTDKKIYVECAQVVDVFTGQCWHAVTQLCSNARRGSADKQPACFELRWPLTLATQHDTEAEIEAALDAHLSFAVDQRCTHVVNAILHSLSKRAFDWQTMIDGNDAECLLPIASMRGDIARAFLYVRLRHFDSLWQGVDNKFKQMLIQWMNDDPVSAIETRRNDIIAKAQGNRNPFVDFLYKHK
jgi:hypothetical protein